METETSGSLLDAKKLQELAGIVPNANITIYWYLYCLINKAFSNKDSAIRHHLDVNPDVHLSKIRKSLGALQRQGWLSPDDGGGFYKSLRARVYQNLQLLPQLYASEYFRTGRSAPRDQSYDFLVYSLIYDARLYTGKPHYRSISNFLIGVGLIKRDAYNAEDVRKHYKRLSREDIDTILIMLMQLDVEFFADHYIPLDADDPTSGFYYEWLQKYFSDSITSQEEILKVLLKTVEKIKKFRL